MKSRFAVGIASVLLFAAAPVFGGTISYTFSGPDVVVSSPATFTAGGISIQAYGLVGLNNNNLYEKDDGISEDGLGLAGTINNEINPPSGSQAILFDLTNLVSAGFTEGMFTLGSLQAGEEGEACILTSGFSIVSCYSGITGDSNSLGTVDVNWGSNALVAFFTDPHQPATAGNFLVSSLDARTPAAAEPGTFGLLAVVLIGFALVSARRFAVERG